MGEAAVLGLLTRVADWHRDAKEVSSAVIPLTEVARDMLTYLDDKLPKLNAVIRTPVFGCDGSLIVAPGYHPRDCVWMDSDPGLRMDRLSNNPTAEDIQVARDLLLSEMLVDFQFTCISDQAHALAALVLPFIRRMVDGPTPLHSIEAPSAGSGKGLLANVIGLVTTGLTCESRTLPGKDDDIRKMITAELIKGRPIVLLDNADDQQKLHSPSLASVLTSVMWTDRVLNQSKMVSVQNESLWMLTGNNPRFDLELTRRSIRARIDTGFERPWSRSEFRHPDLIAWVKANRGLLVHAILTLILRWIAAGKPMKK
jgi:hypothetical protein